MRQLGASPDIVVGSVHAVTEEGQVLIASASGSQMAAYVYGASKVIWVVGTQKLVKNLEEGMQRIKEYSYPLEDARIREIYGRGSILAKLLLVQHEFMPDRTTIILVKENLGF
jgi:acyl-CoA hydrolase